MTRAPRATGAEIVAALGRSGFEVVRIRGSHHFLRHSDGRSTVVPVHRGDTIGPGLTAKILRQADVSAERLAELL